MSLSSKHIGSALVLTAGISWGVISIFVRELTNHGFSAVDITALRNISASVILVLATAIANRKSYAIRWRHLWCFAGTGIASVILFNACYFYAMQHTTVNIAVMLLYTSPVFVSVMSRCFFKETFGIRKVLSVILVLVGCAFVALGGSSSQLGALTPTAFMAGLGAGFCYALYSIFARCAQNRGYTSTTITLWTFIFAGCVSIFMLDFHAAQHAFESAHACWLLLAGLVLISTILPYVTYTAGLKRLPPSMAAVIAAVEPVVGTCVGFIVFGEALSWQAFTGMVLIIGAFFL